MSYFGYVPSEHFSDDAYHYFLNFASPEELETDTTTKETVVKIANTLGSDLTKWGWNNCVVKDNF